MWFRRTGQVFIVCLACRSGYDGETHLGLFLRCIYEKVVAVRRNPLKPKRQLSTYVPSNRSVN